MDHGANDVTRPDQPAPGGPAWISVLSRPTSAVRLVLLAGLPILAGVWLLMSPGIVIARFGAVDLLFNLAGAWRVQGGQVTHVDFHEPLGALNFALTALGFRLLGPGPLAFVAGELVVLAALFAAAGFAALRRLPLAAAVVFVLFAALPAIAPFVPGTELNAFSFAMSYNRYGWGTTGILALILFVPPREGTKGDAVEIAIAAALLLAMFYLKITYFAVGLGALALALLVSDHVRSRWRSWAALGALAVGNALAPHSHAYLSDLWTAVQWGMPKTSIGLHVRVVLTNAPDHALFATGLVAALWLWRRGLAPVRVPVAALFLIMAGILLMAQNTQLRDVPLGGIIAFLLYDSFRRIGPGRRADESAPILLALLIYPLLAIGGMSLSLVDYYRIAARGTDLRIVQTTALKGLATPFDALGERRTPPRVDYISTVVEAAALFADGRRPAGRIQLLDLVNPLPFMLGFPSPRGADLFWDPAAPFRPAEVVFADADYVLIPKAPTNLPLTDKALALYGDYLAKHYPAREEFPLWILLSR